ncbi:unnamed protein product [Diabrotica balteata]|uniref:HTH OST-type domain-containing protein n=1 Tax=Diabrotica balteata TaxID=107213 RepID=A0A9N9T0J4_DIABA|nr:unnamed protein product [Diabrotica balteata]
MDTVKTMVRSVLTSSPASLSVDRLCKEYRDILGENIPFQKLGYNSVEHFLRDIPDTVQLVGSGRFATVNLVFSEKSAHIAQMVSKQKLTKKKRQPYQRRTVVVPPQRSAHNVDSIRPVERQKMVYPPIKPLFPPTQNMANPPIKPLFPPTQNKANPPIKPLFSPTQNMVYPPTKPSRTPTQNNVGTNYSNYKKTIYGPPSPSTSGHSTAGTSSPEQNESRVKPFEYKNNCVNTDLISNVQNLSISKSSQSLNPVRRTNKSLSQNNFGRLQQSQNDHTNIDKHTLTKNDLFSVKDEEDNVPANIKNNLRLLIQQHPEGMWCTELPNAYKKMFKTELKFFELGFRNLIELCVYLKSVFHWVRPGQGDFKLYDRSKPLPNNAEKNFTVASYTKPIETISKTQVDGAVPPLGWDDVLCFLPQNILEPGDEIPRYFVPSETAENDILDVVVCEICDASKFWVYINDGKLDKLMDDMQDFYHKHGDKYKVPKELIRKGLYCASIIFGEYHRGLVTEIMNNGKNKIFYIDYGTIRVDSNELYFLHNRFSELPAQTLRCRLTGIHPVIKGAAWSPECTIEFKSLTKKGKFVAKISRIKWEDQILEVFLADVTSSPVFYINDRLVKHGHAVYVDQEQQTIKVDSLSTQIVSNLHLFPTFMELEYGLAPSYEMDNFYDLNVPIKFCYPQYFDMDYTNEERSNEERFENYENMILQTIRTQKFQFSRKDIAYFEDKSVSYDFFGALRDEIEEFSLKNNLTKARENEKESDSAEELNYHGQEEIQNKLYTEEQDLKIKALNELTINRLLSEDILKDITTIRTYSDASAEDLMKELDGMSEYAESHQSIVAEEEDQDINHKYYDYEKNSEPSDYQNHQDRLLSSITSTQDDLSVVNISRHNSQYPPFKNRFDYSEDNITSPQLQPEGTASETYFEDNISAKICEGSYTEKQKSTNPFWNSDKSSEHINRLHPTNPFLYFLKDEEEHSDQRTLDVSTSVSSNNEVEIQRRLNAVVSSANSVLMTTNNPIKTKNTNVSTACQTNRNSAQSSLDVNAIPFYPAYNCTVPINPLCGYNFPVYDPTVYYNPYYHRTPAFMTPSFTQSFEIPTSFNTPRCPPPPGFTPK